MRRGKAWLASADLRPTRQRLSLAAQLVGDGQDRHVTAESLFVSVSETSEKVSLATVYNTLRTFCDAGLMQEVTVDGTRSYFDTNMSDHPHFYWENSGELTDAPADQLQIINLPDAPEGTEISAVDVVIRLRKT
ncbi:Fur family transcriptional regulator Irr [Pacificibacter maritimus]|nr:transcriptional repressor [Pacificibacter maritimus]